MGIEDRIEKELLERLAKGAYGDIYNFPEVQFTKIIDRMEEKEVEEEKEEEEKEEKDIVMEYVEDLEEFDAEIDIEDFEEKSFTSVSSDDDDMDNDDDDGSTDQDEPKKKDKRKKIEIEYEQEDVQIPSEEVVPGMAW